MQVLIRNIPVPPNPRLTDQARRQTSRLAGTGMVILMNSLKNQKNHPLGFYLLK
jgi:hypothetical protein